MAVSDPTMGVPTPTGTLQGVAAFSWDGSAWQPSGRAGPGVGTPTGVLRGVAPFSWDGAAWQPSGRAQPGVATPTGVLDGVAVFNWSGSAWVPSYGGPGCPTPTGTLRGVAAFNWDGTAWQPVGQAGPSVATPYGALDGVAMFNWTGSAWAAVQGPSLDLVFSGPTLDPRLTFTRASTATYFDSSGVMQTAATNVPRFDYDPVTHAALGLLIEEARTNVVLNSADANNASWAKGASGVPLPTTTANQMVAPDGTTTAAMVVYPAVSGGWSVINPTTLSATANPYSLSVWMKGSVGGEQLYLSATPDGALYYRTSVTLTTAWQRFVLSTPNLTATNWFWQIGTDRRDAGQTSKPAQTLYVWGGQLEQGAFATSYVPTTAAAVTRSGDVCQIPTGAWYNANTFSMNAEYYQLNPPPGAILGVSDNAFGENTCYLSNGGLNKIGTGQGSAGTGFGTPSVVNKICGTFSTTQLKGVINGGVVGTYNGTMVAPTGALRMTIGSAPWIPSSGQFDCHMRRARFWPRVLSDSELQSVTT